MCGFDPPPWPPPALAGAGGEGDCTGVCATSLTGLCTEGAAGVGAGAIAPATVRVGALVSGARAGGRLRAVVCIRIAGALLKCKGTAVPANATGRLGEDCPPTRPRGLAARPIAKQPANNATHRSITTMIRATVHAHVSSCHVRPHCLAMRTVFMRTDTRSV